MLNAQSPVPLYRQLAQRIQSDIESGLHAVNSRIPSENNLAKRYAIGRPTVRQATDLLVREGRLERRRGSGTFVLPPRRAIDLFSLAGTSAALDRDDLNANLEIIGQPSREALLINCTDGVFKNAASMEGTAADSSREWIKVQRRALVDGLPVLCETFWFAADVFADLDKFKLENRSLSALVRDEYYLQTTAMEQQFLVTHADAFLAQQLEVELDAPLLRVLRSLCFGELIDVLYVEINCLTDRFAFSQTLLESGSVADNSGFE